MTKTPFLILFVILISVGVTSAYAINITLGGAVDITQILNMMGNKITNLGTPTTDTDAATKGYVDQSPTTDTLAVLGCTTNQIAKYTSGFKMFVVDAIGGEVNEYTLTTGFDVSTTSFVDSFSVAGQEAIPTDLAFSSDGAKMFVVGGGDAVHEYTLSTPFDVSTGIFVDSFSVAAQETNPEGLAFSPDGTKMFVVGFEGDDVNEYTLTTPFDVSTAAFVDAFSVAAQETTPQGVAFSSDGIKMFVVGTTGADINEYTLSAPFDVSTASFVDSFSVAGQETGPAGLAFSSDGTKMFVVGFVGDNVNEYTLSTPFDVSTAAFVDAFSVAGQDTAPTGIAFSSDGVWVCSDDSKLCSNNTSQVGPWCIDNSVRSADTSPNAVKDCADEGMLVTPLKALIICDTVNLSTSDCDAKTDAGDTVQLWTSDISHRDSAASETFGDNIITYKGDNTVDEVDSTGLSFEYFCVKPLT